METTPRSEPHSFSIHTNAAAFRISEEQIAFEFGFTRKGHMEPVRPTPEQRVMHARALALVAELEKNPYVQLDGYDLECGVRPLETERWVPDETYEEWLTRWRAWRAENPDARPVPNVLGRLVAESLSKAMDRSVVANIRSEGGAR